MAPMVDTDEVVGKPKTRASRTIAEAKAQGSELGNLATHHNGIASKL